MKILYKSPNSTIKYFALKNYKKFKFKKIIIEKLCTYIMKAKQPTELI